MVSEIETATAAVAALVLEVIVKVVVAVGWEVTTAA